MSVIAPAILAENQEQYRAIVEKLHPFTERAHIDITDGEFAATFTVSASQAWWPQEWTADIHAMVARPSEYIDTLVNLKPNLVIFHAEVQEDLLPTFEHLRRFDIKVGVALQRPTVPADNEAVIKSADHVMIFSGDLGRYGGTASLMQIEKVRLIRAINPNAEIGWDGGVAMDNAFSLAQGGVDVLNVGSALQKAADPKSAYDKLVREINKRGVI